jgi:hypothetical protein
MVDCFSVTLKPEVTRLDNSGMNGADGNLVDLLSVDAKEIGLPYCWSWRPAA